MEKEKFEPAKIEVIVFDSEDIIRTSGDIDFEPEGTED